MNVIVGMKEINTPFKRVGLRFFKAFDGKYYFKVGKQPRKRLFSHSQTPLSKKLAN